MIQDIGPMHLDNAYRDVLPEGKETVLCFEKDRAAVNADDGRLVFPRREQLGEDAQCAYAFSLGEKRFFLETGVARAPESFGRYTLHELRGMPLIGNADLFAVYTGYHLWKWYQSSRFCGCCGQRTELAHDERALVCPACGNRIYPRINPAVIVGVTDGERLLITRYKSGFRHNALIAGFTEIGETAEETVRREVMEEVGLRVKNIRYYKSQPWGIASDILMGFYCEADGDTNIRRDDRELGYAQWVERKDIVLQPTEHSLTNEMMKRFRDGKM